LRLLAAGAVDDTLRSMAIQSKILLVEDHDDIRRAMAKLLTFAGHTVVEASAVAADIACIDGQAIALLDSYLPDGLGTEVLQHIRKQHHHTRVAFTTAASDLRLAQSLLGPGDRIFQKPVDFKKLLKWVSEPCRSR
jgi:DNA-binding NtrC family response regulator